MKKLKNKLTNIIWLIAIALWVWFVLSYIDVISHNLDPVPMYQSWNIFRIVFLD